MIESVRTRFAVRLVTGFLIAGGLLALCACGAQGSPSTTSTAGPAPVASAIASMDADLESTTPLPTETAPLPRVADLAIVALGPVDLVPGGTAIYTLTVRNLGPDPATDLVLDDRLPQGLTPAWTRPGPTLCWQQDGSLGCDLGQLQGGEAVTVSLDLSLAGTGTTTSSSQPSGLALEWSVPTCRPDLDPDQPGVACHLARLPPGAEVQMRIAADVDPHIGATLAHTVTVAANEVDPNGANNQGLFPLMLSTAAQPRPAPGPTPQPAAGGLALQAAGPPMVVAGLPFTYTFTLTNQGTAEVHGLRLESVLPPATELAGLAPQPPHCRQQGQTFICSLANLDGTLPVTFTLTLDSPGEQPMVLELDPLLPGWPACTVLKERTFLHIILCEFGVLKAGQSARAQVALSARGVHERIMDYTAVILADEDTGHPLAVTRTVPITVQVRADLDIVSQVLHPAAEGAPLTYTLTVANHGPSDAVGVLLTDTWPSEARLISARPGPGGHCRVEPGKVTTAICDLGRLDAPTSTTITVTVALDGPLAHSVTVRSEQADPHLDNNDLTESINPDGDGND